MTTPCVYGKDCPGWGAHAPLMPDSKPAFCCEKHIHQKSCCRRDGMHGHFCDVSSWSLVHFKTSSWHHVDHDIQGCINLQVAIIFHALFAAQSLASHATIINSGVLSSEGCSIRAAACLPRQRCKQHRFQALENHKALDECCTGAAPAV